MEEQWQNGLCREFTKAVGEIIKLNKLPGRDYDLDKIGYEVIRLHNEIFNCSKVK